MVKGGLVHFSYIKGKVLGGKDGQKEIKKKNKT